MKRLVAAALLSAGLMTASAQAPEAAPAKPVHAILFMQCGMPAGVLVINSNGGYRGVNLVPNMPPEIVENITKLLNQVPEQNRKVVAMPCPCGPEATPL